MRILWVKAGKLLPVDTGGKIRSYNILQKLAARNEVTLLSYYGGRRDYGYEREIKNHFPRAVTIYTAAPDSTTIERGLDYLRRLPQRAPYAITKFSSREVRQMLKEWLGENRFDVAVCDFLSVSLNFPALLETKTVLFQHNVESALWQRQAQHEPNLVKRLLFKLEAAKMTRYEHAAVKRFHQVIAVSEHDREQMSAMTDPSRISVVPTGVDLKQYRASATASATEKLVIFVGSMDWEANIDGVDYFCREVWPAVKKSVPAARLRIVGRNPHQRVKRWVNDSIEVTGTVASVVEHYQQAAVNIVPLRIGGGTRLKIYEAMATGKATVSTSIGAEGLDVEDGRDILLADTAAKFADSVVKLLADEQLRQQIETAAARKAAQYDWMMIADRFYEVLSRVQTSAEAFDSAPSAITQVSAL
ncbi:MAG TPA: glycosyltransferase family 4 protein [Blastocatellia bacterium]|nr:glycosyltransferase family 4 protein [Blastocatellia bacterium]